MTDFYYFGLCRVILGLYLLTCWFWDLPFASVTFDSFENLFMASILWIIPFTIGWNRKLFAGIGVLHFLILGYFFRILRSPEINFVVFQLALWTLMPAGEWGIKKEGTREWKVHPEAQTVFAWVLGLAHFFAGLSKIFSFDTSWIDGTALKVLLETSPWLRENSAEILLKLPEPILSSATYFALIIEMAGLLMLHRKTRNTAVLMLIGFHSFSIFLFQLPQVSIGMVVVLLFLKPSIFNSRPTH